MMFPTQDAQERLRSVLGCHAPGNRQLADLVDFAADLITELEAEAEGRRDFYPDAAHINALPERLRNWIRDLETEADPAGTIQRAYAAELDRDEARLAVGKFKVEAEALRQKVATVEVPEYRHLRAIELVARRVHQEDKGGLAGTALNMLSLGNALESLDRLRVDQETSNKPGDK